MRNISVAVKNIYINIFLCIMLSVIFSLTGCSALLPPVNSPEKHTYLFTTPDLASLNIKNKINKNNILILAKPQSVSWLDTERMAYQLKPDSMDYFGENQWAATPAELLQPVVANALRRANIYRAVLLQSTGGQQNLLQLNLRILKMQQQFFYHPSRYILNIDAQLSRYSPTAGSQLIAAREFDIVTTASEDNPKGGVMAANQAVNQFLSQLIEFMYAHRNSQ